MGKASGKSLLYFILLFFINKNLSTQKLALGFYSLIERLS